MRTASAQRIAQWALLAALFLVRHEAWGREAPNATEANAEARAEELFVLGQRDEESGAFASALERDRACIAASPEGAWARRAAQRAEWLSQRSEGGFGPLAEVERMKRDPARASDPKALADLATSARSFPAGFVRSEARMVVAEAWLGRFGRPGDALPLLREVATDPSADPLTARLAERELVDALVAEGKWGEAAGEVHAHADRLDPRFVAHVTRLAWRRVVRAVAGGALTFFLLLATSALVRAMRVGARPWRRTPLALAFGAYIAIVGGGMASSYEAGNAAPFVLFGIALVPLLTIARAWGDAGATHAAARAGRAAVCAVTVFATAFVLLEAVNSSYLEGFGL